MKARLITGVTTRPSRSENSSFKGQKPFCRLRPLSNTGLNNEGIGVFEVCFIKSCYLDLEQFSAIAISEFCLCSVLMVDYCRDVLISEDFENFSFLYVDVELFKNFWWLSSDTEREIIFWLNNTKKTVISIDVIFQNLNCGNFNYYWHVHKY